MVEYIPPPDDLSTLNPIQRYMQKGQLDKQDWIRLCGLVVLYFVLRPYIQKAAKWWFSDEKVVAGEKARQEHLQKRAKAQIDANTIRSGKKQEDTIVETLDEDQSVAVSGSRVNDAGGVINRKSKSQPAGNKSLEEQLLDWDDEPARKHVEGERADVVEWLNKWDR